MKAMSRKMSPFKALARLVLLLAGAVGAYWYWLRPWHRAWGTAPGEDDRILPGDELLPEACYSATHAVTINAPPEQVWPWIVQMGTGRAGFYSYDFIENAMGLDIHSASRVRPELQNLKVGDVFPVGPNGIGPRVATLESNHLLVLQHDPDAIKSVMPTARFDENLSAVWVFLLEPINAQTTRLLERFRLDYTPSAPNTALYRALVEPGSFLMERKMLLGIKERAEGQHAV